MRILLCHYLLPDIHVGDSDMVIYALLKAALWWGARYRHLARDGGSSGSSSFGAFHLLMFVFNHSQFPIPRQVSLGAVDTFGHVQKLAQ